MEVVLWNVRGSNGCRRQDLSANEWLWYGHSHSAGDGHFGFPDDGGPGVAVMIWTQQSDNLGELFLLSCCETRDSNFIPWLCLRL